jgi:tricorn protease
LPPRSAARSADGGRAAGVRRRKYPARRRTSGSKHASGYFRVSYIYKNGPADRDYVKLAAGNYVLSVNGKELKTGDNYWKLFNILPGRKFEFLVNSKPSRDAAWTVTLEPLSAAAQGNLAYDRWVDERKAMAAKISGGKVGYLRGESR